MLQILQNHSSKKKRLRTYDICRLKGKLKNDFAHKIMKNYDVSLLKKDLVTLLNIYGHDDKQ